LDGVSSLDAEGPSLDKKVPRALRETIRNEFAEISESERPIALIARCYLGHPHEVHVLDCRQETAEHFKIGQPLPPYVERARQLARHSAYAFIEVYEHQLRAIGRDGAVTILQM